MGIGRNLLRGEGFVDFPGVPPNLWRQPLAPVLAGVSGFVFLTARRIMGGGVGLLAAALTATSPALLVALAQCHTMADGLLLGIIAPAMYCVLVAGETRSLRYYAWAGLLLGLAFMANAAGPLYLAAAALWLLFVRYHSGGTEDTAEAGSWIRRHQAVPCSR